MGCRTVHVIYLSFNLCVIFGIEILNRFYHFTSLKFSSFLFLLGMLVLVSSFHCYWSKLLSTSFGPKKVQLKPIEIEPPGWPGGLALRLGDVRWVLSIPKFGYALCPSFNQPPASGGWDCSPGLVSPWTGYQVIKKKYVERTWETLSSTWTVAF